MLDPGDPSADPSPTPAPTSPPDSPPPAEVVASVVRVAPAAHSTSAPVSTDVTIEFDRSLTLLRNVAPGVFQPADTLDAGGTGETACTAGDANGDGITDLFIGNHSSLTVSVLLGDGDGGFSVAGSFPAGGDSWMLASGDLNGDGHLDVVSANSRADNVGILFGVGNGRLQAAQTLPTGGFPIAVDLGDLDGDGDLDMVVSNFETADWSVFETTERGVSRPQ